MRDRSGRGPTELDMVDAELDRLRATLARHRRTSESIEEHRRMAEDLESIHAGLKRLASKLEQPPEATR